MVPLSQATNCDQRFFKDNFLMATSSNPRYQVWDSVADSATLGRSRRRREQEQEYELVSVLSASRWAFLKCSIIHQIRIRVDIHTYNSDTLITHETGIAAVLKIANDTFTYSQYVRLTSTSLTMNVGLTDSFDWTGNSHSRSLILQYKQ